MERLSMEYYSPLNVHTQHLKDWHRHPISCIYSFSNYLLASVRLNPTRIEGSSNELHGLDQESANSFCKGSDSNCFGLGGHTISVTTTQLRHGSMNAAIDNTTHQQMGVSVSQ